MPFSIKTRLFGWCLRFIIVIGAITPLSCRAQQVSQPSDTVEIARNNLFVELLGNGVIGSLNYEYLVTNHWSARLGICAVPWFVAAVTTVSYLVGSRNEKLEFGGGGGLFGGGGSHGGLAGLYFTSIIAYRYQPANGGFFFKIGVSPTIRFEEATGGGKEYIYTDFGSHWGLSVGLTF